MIARYSHHAPGLWSSDWWLKNVWISGFFSQIFSTYHKMNEHNRKTNLWRSNNYILAKLYLVVSWIFFNMINMCDRGRTITHMQIPWFHTQLWYKIICFFYQNLKNGIIMFVSQYQFFKFCNTNYIGMIYNLKDIFSIYVISGLGSSLKTLQVWNRMRFHSISKPIFLTC